MRHLIFLSVMAVFLSPAVALAQANCGERTRFLDFLSKSHKEVPTAMGVTTSGRVVEVLTSLKGTWTIIMTDPSGKTCMVGVGIGWEDVPRKTPTSGKPS